MIGCSCAAAVTGAGLREPACEPAAGWAGGSLLAEIVL